MSGCRGQMVSVNDDCVQEKLHADPIDVNTSLSALSHISISLDSILEKCGAFGRFHVLHYFFISLISMSAGIMGFYYVYAAAQLNHRCRLPETVWPNDFHYNPINRTHEIFINTYIPRTKDGKKWERCQRYTTANPNDTLVNCPNGWAYDRSTFGYTFTEEADFVCQNEPKKSWLATMLQAGGFSSLIIGPLADRYGRKKLVSIILILIFIICLITQCLIEWLPMTIEIKFFILLINQFVCGLTTATFSLVFILLFELTSSAHTSLAGNIALISFTIGEIVVTLFAYFVKHWQILKWLNTAFIGLILPYLYFMPESPLYFYSKRDFHQLERLLRRIANTNHRKEIEWYPYYQTFIENHPLIPLDQDKITFCQKMQQILTHRQTIIKLLIISLLGFTTLLVYIKISYALAFMNISPYLGIILGAVVEAVGYITGSLLILTKLARKGSFILTMIVTSICVLSIPFLMNISDKTTVFIGQFGKYTIASALVVSWIFIPELFPTSIRSSANGVFIATGRVGAIVAPIIDTSIKADYLPYTFYIAAGLGLLVVFSTLYLPETKDRPMEEIQDPLVRTNA